MLSVQPCPARCTTTTRRCRRRCRARASAACRSRRLTAVAFTCSALRPAPSQERLRSPLQETSSTDPYGPTGHQASHVQAHGLSLSRHACSLRQRTIPGLAPSGQPRSSATPLHPLAGVKTTAHCEDPGHAVAAPRAPNHTSTRRSPATRRHTRAGCARRCVPSSNASFRRSLSHRLPGYLAPFPDSRRLRGSALAPASLRDPTSGSIRPGVAVPRGTSWSSAPPHPPTARCRTAGQHRTRAGS